MSGPEIDRETALRLGGCYRTLLERLHEIGPIYLQGRNRGGGLGKAVDRFRPILLEEPDFALDPHCGVGIATGELIAIHAGMFDMKRYTVPVLDFEFAGFAAGFSLMEIPGMSLEGGLRDFVSSQTAMRLPLGELTRWREEIETPVDMCGRCRGAAEQRARAIEAHPLYWILQHALSVGMPLRCRILGDHIDFAADLSPHRVLTGNGYLVTIPADSRSALHIDMRMVHALRISSQRIDGIECGSLEIFDMHGSRNFQLTSEVVGAESLWRGICEEERNLFEPLDEDWD